MSSKFRNYHAKEFYNQILFESENFIVVPSLGALVEGWVLIVPKKEYLSYQYMRDVELLLELEELSEKIGQIILNEYGYVTMFEHGAFNSNSTVGCGVDYAHLHLVPINYDLIFGLQKFLDINYSWEVVSGLSEALLCKKEMNEYLYLKNNEGISHIINGCKFPSQLFRKVIAHYIHTPDMYDWKVNFQNENVVKTIERLSIVTNF